MQKDANKYDSLEAGFTFNVVASLPTSSEANKAEAQEIQRLRAAGVQLYNRITGNPAVRSVMWALKKRRR